jgi:RNA polymerase subunit RPABC4/transcription elongation factor Spt4
VVSVLIVLLMIVGGLSALTTARGSTAPAGSSSVTPAGTPFTHGNLVVPNGTTFVIQPTAGSRTYYQGGDITVYQTGTLIVLNVTLSFVQYVSDTGTALQRLSHIDHFIDKGTVHFYNSTLTTDVQVINAYAKLNVTIVGAMTLWNSTFAFPGWVNVEGASANLTLNDSRVTGNPAVLTLSEPGTILGDTEYAPSIWVTSGAQLNVLGSSLNNTYADNTLNNGPPQPVPLGVRAQLNPGLNYLGNLSGSNGSAALVQDWLYPNAVFRAGDLIVGWGNPNTVTPASISAKVVYNGVVYPLTNSCPMAPGTAGFCSFPLSSTLLQTITNDGVLNYLNWTGNFSVGPSKIAIELPESSGGPPVNISANLSLLPSPQYNLLVSGAGSVVNAVDSSFDLNWNAVPSNSTSQTAPVPWASNKLLVTAGARAFLANVTVAASLPGVFSYSAVLPDATSAAFFYRWAQFNVTGSGGYLPVPDAQVSAYYAYSATTNQTDNKTANALNNLASADPVIWGYVQYWDAVHGVTAYGRSNVTGIASVLLASSNVTGPTLPDGLFVGDYHVGVVVPAVGVGSHWFNWSVSPYPDNVALSPPFLAGPDFGPVQKFPQYFGGVAIESVTVLTNGVASTTLNLGQTLDVKVVVQDIGSAPVTQVQGDLYYNGSSLPSAHLASYNNTTLDLSTPGQTVTFTLAWKATGNVTGLQPNFEHTLTLIVDWNYNNARLAGGNLSQNVSVKFVPTVATVGSATVFANGAAMTTVDLGQTLGVNVVVNDTGNGTITAVSAWLYYYNNSSRLEGLLASYENTSVDLTGAGQSLTFLLSWKATENVTGLHGWFWRNLTLSLTWNNNNNSRWLGNGSLARNVSVKFAPSEIRFTAFSLPPQTLDLLASYVSIGTLEYNGSQPAAIYLYATPVGGGTPVEIAALTTLPGNFSMPWFALTDLAGTPLLAPGTSYNLTATASYNNRETNSSLGTYAVPPTPTSSTNFFLQKFLGLPLWAWIAIAAAVAIAIILFLFVVRRQAAGKLVECGECGNLIPEDATVCPKCGAEFETDLIRCSRCASTIPADSKFCPECAAQLLGTPGEAASDPEKQAYADFTEKYRAEGKRELGDNYSEGAFWDWWKRQPTYTPFSQWTLQQGQGTARAGMTAPPVGTETTPEAAAGSMPPKKGGPGWSEAPPEGATAPTPGAPAAPPPAPVGAGLKACPSCGKEIPTEYLVCPFCNAVTS